MDVKPQQSNSTRHPIIAYILTLLRVRHYLKIRFYRFLCIDEDRGGVAGTLERISATTHCDTTSYPEIDCYGSTKTIQNVSIIKHQNGITRQLLALSNAHIVGSYGLLLSARRKLLTHRIGGVERIALRTPSLIWKSLFTSYSKPQRHYQEIYTTHCTNTSNYFHWVLEFLAGLSGYEVLTNLKNREIPILLQAPNTGRQRRWLELIGYPYIEIEPDDKTHFTADTVYFSSNEYDTYANLDKASCHWLRKRFLDSVERSDPSKLWPRKIYINRRDTEKSRGISNAEQIEAFMISQGFISITISEHSVDEQIQLFNNADIVVGEHGAGLANVLFCDDSDVVEIFPYNYHNNDIAVLALNTNNRYAAVFGYDSKNAHYPNSVDTCDIQNAIATCVK